MRLGLAATVCGASLVGTQLALWPVIERLDRIEDTLTKLLNTLESPRTDLAMLAGELKIFEAMILTLLGVTVLWRPWQLDEPPEDVGGRHGRRRGRHRRGQARRYQLVAAPP